MPRKPGAMGPAPVAADIIAIATRCRDKLGLELRILMSLDITKGLKVRAEIFRVAEGVRIGISAYEEYGYDFDRGLMGAAFRTSFRAYYDAEAKAHVPPKRGWLDEV